MATVYKAYDTRLERDVALKVIRVDQFAPVVLERILKRFEREAKALARLSHINIIKVIDYGEHEGSPYLVMEYLPAGTLKEKLGKPIPWQEAFRLLLPVAGALDYAHEQGVIHRDVKPSNILLNPRGQPFLTDFGVAKILDLEQGQTLTGTGVGIGTPEYMSPEQCLGRLVDNRSDIYSLGVVLYEMITGRKPYTADTPMAVIDKHLHDPLPRPTQVVRDLPEAVEKVLLKTLAKAPGDRYKDMAAFAGAMESLLTGERQPSPAKFKTGERSTFETVENGSFEADDQERTIPQVEENPLDNPKPPLKKRKFPAWVFGVAGLLLLVLVISILFLPRNLHPDPTSFDLTQSAVMLPSRTPLNIISPTLRISPTLSSTFTSVFTPTLSPSITNTPLPLEGLEGTWRLELNFKGVSYFDVTIIWTGEGYDVSRCTGSGVDLYPRTIWDPSVPQLSWACGFYDRSITPGWIPYIVNLSTASLSEEGLLINCRIDLIGVSTGVPSLRLMHRAP